MPGLGRHLLADLYECGCGFDALNDPERLLALVLEAVRASGATIMSHHIQPFSPHGVTGVVVVAESHLSFHTWPEHAFISLDYFTCGHRVDMDAALQVITTALAPVRVDRQVHDRGAALEGLPHHPGAR